MDGQWVYAADVRPRDLVEELMEAIVALQAQKRNLYLHLGVES